MATVKNQKVIATLVVVYSVIFYFVWALCETWLKSWLTVAQHEWFREIILKLIIWTIPALLLIRIYGSALLISLKEMLTTRVAWGRYFFWFALFTVYLFVGAIIRSGSLSISPHFSLLSVVIVLSIGLGEELVFRGWLLNATLPIFGIGKQWLAIALNALLFLCIHFPLWLYTGTFTQMLMNFGFAAVLGLSVIFSTVFIKSRSIWPPIALHVYWDLLMILFLSA